MFRHNFFSRVARRTDSGSWPSLRGFAITHTGHITLNRTPLEEWSARRRNINLTTHSNHKRQTSLPRRDSNLQSEQASGIDRSATRIGRPKLDEHIYIETDGQTLCVIKTVVISLILIVPIHGRLCNAIYSTLRFFWLFGEIWEQTIKLHGIKNLNDQHLKKFGAEIC